MEPAPIGWIPQLIGFIALFPFSILFSASETALISMTENDLIKLKEAKDKKSKKIFELLSTSSDNLLITLLYGNNLVNVGIATLGTLLTTQLTAHLGISDGYGLLLVVAVVSFLILLIGEIIPKTIAIRNNIEFSRKIINVILFFYALFYPVTYITGGIVKLLTSKFENFQGLSKITQYDIKNLMEVGGEDGVLEEDEKNMITSIFEFASTTAKEIMVPRVDIIALEDDIPFDELLKNVKENSFSRMPIYHETIDNIIGVLYVKDLLEYVNKSTKNIKISELVRDVNFIPESKDIGDLLKQFQKEKTHISIVVDEYGGTAGMITLEDIIEEIVGEIQDEFDEDENLFHKLDENTYEFDAKITIDDINEILDSKLPEEEDFESLGGFIYFLFEEVPEKGDSRNFENLNFTIKSVDKQRIGWVKIEKIMVSDEL